MAQFEIKSGNSLVRCFSNGPDAQWHSRVYVNGGEDATLVTATHRTEKGARAWAARRLSA